MAFLGVLGEAVSGEGARKAGKSVGKAQNAAADQFRPYQSIGTGALEKIAGFYGIPVTGPDGKPVNTPKQDMGSFLNSLPGYQAGLDAATQALARGASASGRLGSGGFGVDLAKLGMQYGNQIFNQEMNRLQGLGGMGMDATNTMGQYRTGGAQSRAQGRLAQQGSIMSTIGSGVMMAGMGGIPGFSMGGLASMFGGGAGGSSPMDLAAQTNPADLAKMASMAGFM